MENLSVNPRIITALKRANLRSFESVLHLSPADLGRCTKLSSRDVSVVIKAVSEEVYKIKYTTALTLSKQRKEDCLEPTHLTTGCPILDDFLHGGILVKGITEVAGQSAAGKTQFCLQLCLTAQLPIQQGGLACGVVYICTEDVFPSKRLQQLISSFNRKIGPSLAKQLAVGDRIYVEHVAEKDQLWHCLEKRLPLLLSRGMVKLAVVDSLAAIFRSEFELRDTVKRARELQRVGAHLHRLSSQYNAAVVCVNQVTANMKASLDPTESDMMPALGLTWSNIVKVRLMLSRTPYRLPPSDATNKRTNRTPVNGECSHESELKAEVPVRQIEILFAPHLPKDVCYYIVDADGVKGLQ
ncbi:DNA repair protein XRCC3-like [Lytechinus variegatus]|uniref:DNA repair protein XRCC3-like n=1 Tax=Lytechinus variegatus TaxID=7654 RepID=UPI001BB0E9BB|nr:DNA repair protein XRCC3-like [Lytechinus variegatus]